MSTLLIAIGSFIGFLIAYHTYGRWVAKRIFQVDRAALVPSHELRDDTDYVPTNRHVIFGHHFTSIAGTGPIVGPAIAVFWGWLPALLWVVFGSIFIGAVHDLGSLVISLRNRGQTVGEIAGRLITPRARILFLLILFFALTVVLAIFGLVIANIFKIYPESVIATWISLPVAMVIGVWSYKTHGKLLIPSLLSLAILYGAIVIGVDGYPVMVNQVPDSSLVNVQVGNTTLLRDLPLENPIVAWTAVLMVYCFFASVLPVWLLLQPRDFINSHQLLLALVLLLSGLFVAGMTGKAELFESTPAVIAQQDLPANTPLLFPFLFITVACGACSGFHCLVSSGTSSKQVANEEDAQYVAYGSMLLEGALAVIVILACTAGVGMGLFSKQADGRFVQILNERGTPIQGHEAWQTRYSPQQDWEKFGLGATVGAFVEGGANFLSALGLPLRYGVGIIATLVACFAATTLDTATRLQRYVIQELGTTFHLPPVQNKYGATSLAVGLGLAMAMIPGPTGEMGSGGLILWPLFGAVNQLLAGLAFMVVVFYLWRRSKPILFAALPMLLMLLLPAWAMIIQMQDWLATRNWLLLGMSVVILCLQVWMIVEGILVWQRSRGVLEESLPALSSTPAPSSASAS